MGFFEALSFLTVIRTGSGKVYDDKDVVKWGRYFFLVGLLIGALAYGLDFLLMRKLSPLAESVILVLFIALITGGLHLDGLCDTFDAAFSMKPVSEKLSIMKDSRVGAFGVIAIVFVILLKVVFLAEIIGAGQRGVILLFPAISRACMLLPSYLFSYPRESGKGAGFVNNMTINIVLVGLIPSAIILYLIMQAQGLLLLIAALIFSVSLAFFFNKRFNGITGDVLGCINELSEVFVLFIAILRPLHNL